MNERMKSWVADSKSDYDKNFDFLSGIKGEELELDTLREAHDHAFAQIECLSCANCCKTAPPIILRSDAKRIAKYLGDTPKSFLRKYTIEDVTGEYVMKSVPCVFLQEDNYCSIYEVRPEACRRFPHTDEKEYVRRVKLNADNTLVCPAAYEVVNYLKRIL